MFINSIHKSFGVMTVGIFQHKYMSHRKTCMNRDMEVLINDSFFFLNGNVLNVFYHIAQLREREREGD